MTVQRIPEIVEERHKFPCGTRRPPGEAAEVRGQRQQGIRAAAGGREDSDDILAIFGVLRIILLPESHVDTALEADVTRVEGMSLEIGVGGVSQESLQGGLLGRHTMAIVMILPTSVLGDSRTVRL
ncbi:5-hydroxytryptamine receptor 7, putative [Babesia ovata]|uniref:5-hydroxytryptamine receptor 7, putative n=1 Tax=Babesia ovata TaxID=189622 RepID=A0A2H6KFY7_9APIC|nr:5-hydroxytryptamine receptor 7, putative [Babesia ovata]GBE61905.1 5-hydroxytryptamine receptor 7, putative [Babesia ovata]